MQFIKIKNLSVKICELFSYPQLEMIQGHFVNVTLIHLHSDMLSKGVRKGQNLSDLVPHR